MTRFFRLTVLLAAAIALGAASNPWTPADLMSPEVLAQTLKDGKTPMILYVGFPVLYRGAHIPTAVLAGPVSKPEGVEALKAALNGVPLDRQIVVYCGCCPWDKCPNIRPAFKLIRELGYKDAKLVTIPTNLHTDWVEKGFPVDKPAVQK